jgi:hypothetical protein
MFNTVRAVVKNGKIELGESVDVPDGTEVLVTVLSNGDDFWLGASESSLSAVWDNPEDDIYAELLQG